MTRISGMIAAAGVLLLAGAASGQERLEWDLAPGRRYALAWQLETTRRTASQDGGAISAGVRTVDPLQEAIEATTLEVELELTAPATAGAQPALAGRIERLSLSARLDGLLLEVRHGPGTPLQARIAAVPGRSYADPAQEQRDRDRLAELQAGLEADVRDGLSLVFPADERPRLERAAPGPAPGGSAALWGACFLQPVVPAPLQRGTAWPVPAGDLPWIAPGSPGAPSYRVDRLDRRAVRLGYDARHREGTDTRPDLVAGHRLQDRKTIRREALLRLEFDRASGCLARCERTVSSSVRDAGLVDGQELTWSEESLELRSTVRVTPRP